jgi:hypothetical protein
MSEYKRSYWGDILVTLHLPRAACFYAFVIIGSFLSPVIHWDRLILSLLSTFFFLQLTAYALDEFKGRHCGTSLTRQHLFLRVWIGSLCAIITGAYLIFTVSLYLLPLSLIGIVLIFGYNYETLGLHSRFVFMVAWGFFPLVGNYYLQSLSFPTLTVIVWGMFAMVFAYLHIITYGNCGCRVHEKCLDAPRWDCHGQVCNVRLTLPKSVHKLQKRIASYEVLMLLIIAIAVVVSHYGW